MADTDWKARIKKWEDGIKFDTANTPSKEDVLEYIATKIHQYTIERITDDNLWYGFKEDFRNFELTNFSGVHWTSLQRLRGCLRCGGVRVEQNTSRLNIAQSLYNILLEETPHTWSAADLSQAATDFQKGPMTSVFITADGKHRRLEQTSGADKGTGVGAGGGYGGHQSPPRPPIGDPDGPSGGQGTPPQPLDVSQATIAAKLIGEIAKIVTNDQKYDGTNGSFNQKQTIPHDICRRVEIPQEAMNTENKPTYEAVQSMVNAVRKLQYGQARGLLQQSHQFPSLIKPARDTVLVIRRSGHSFLLWDASLQTVISDSFNYNPWFLTETELRRLHRRFGVG